MSEDNLFAENRRLEVRTVNRVKIVRLLGCERLNFEDELDALRNDLLGMLDEPCDLVLNLTGMKYFSSILLSAIVRVRFQVARMGARMALCHLEPGVIEIFQATRTDSFFAAITTSEEAALAALEAPTPVYLSCPVNPCGGRTAVPRGGMRNPEDFLSCPQCRAQFRVGPWPPTGPPPTIVTVLALRLMTYVGEHIDAIPGLPSFLSLSGRLDLFASEVLEKIWLNLPPPRRVVVDLRAATEVSDPGALALLRMCQDKDNRAALLVDASKPEQARALSCGTVCQTRDEGIAALGDLPGGAPTPVTVTVHNAA
jgi:anti-anti-sigma factor